MPVLELIETSAQFNAESSPDNRVAPAGLYGRRDFSLAFVRFQDAVGVRTMQALAELFRGRQSFVSDVKRREKIPATWLYHLLLTRRVSPQWIIFGTGPRELALVDMVDESVAALLLRTATE